MTKTLTEQIVNIQNDIDVVFDEVVKLEKKLTIATKALKEYSVSDNWFMEDSEGNCWSFNKQYPWRIGFKALKEMEGVK